MDEKELGNYVVTETGPYTSLDPLDADSSLNLPVARMLYLTPFEMSEDDKLKSSLLEHFEFSTRDNVATWVVRKDLKYDNGTSVTPEDVAFSVARMAYVRPLFPVIREIAGVQDWLKSKDALSTYPKGITVEGQKISIRLSNPVDHPLFRFVLELFSVIPKSCVDLMTNKLVCARPPASGYYRIKSESKDEIIFEARSDFPAGVHLPRQKLIRFHYKKPASIVDSSTLWPKKTVIAGNESSFSDDELAKLQKLFHLRPLPKNRFAALQINPNAKAFVAQECRLAFLQRFRDKLIEVGVLKQDVEASLTMAILPGYLDWEELRRRAIPVSVRAFEKCAKELKRNPVEFTVWEGQRFSLAEQAVVATLASFGQKITGPTVET